MELNRPTGDEPREETFTIELVWDAGDDATAVPWEASSSLGSWCPTLHVVATFEAELEQILRQPPKWRRERREKLQDQASTTMPAW